MSWSLPREMRYHGDYNELILEPDGGRIKITIEDILNMEGLYVDLPRTEIPFLIKWLEEQVVE